MSDLYTLEKSLWTEADYEEMGWHDATIHAIAMPNGEFELVLDIDYILKWVDPAEKQTHYRFWVAPATLVFWNLYDLQLDLEPHDGFTIQGIERSDPTRPKNADHIGKELEWLWKIEMNEGDVSFRSCGFTQHFRNEPQFGKCQALSLEERGGYSFDRPGEWLKRDV